MEKIFLRRLWVSDCVSIGTTIQESGTSPPFLSLIASQQASLRPPLNPGWRPVQDRRTVSISCGAEHSVVSTAAGEVFAWGWGRYGNVGDGQRQDRRAPPALRSCRIWGRAGGRSGGGLHSVVCPACLLHLLRVSRAPCILKSGIAFAHCLAEPQSLRAD